ncbi:MAG: hypothetical protein JW974_01400 [Alphaproteobacteria bacterium]|nr:hypothetical protein [Alphaproteobacteria bacterium]MBN2675439.1 hypothetical protein [Alphaproteobacteria bacterium]
MLLNYSGLKIDDYEYRTSILEKIQLIENKIKEVNESINNIDKYIRFNNQSSQELSEARTEISEYEAKKMSLLVEQLRLKKNLGIDPAKKVEDLKINLDHIRHNRDELRQIYNYVFPKPPFNWNKQR